MMSAASGLEKNDLSASARAVVPIRRCRRHHHDRLCPVPCIQRPIAFKELPAADPGHVDVEQGRYASQFCENSRELTAIAGIGIVTACLSANLTTNHPTTPSLKTTVRKLFLGGACWRETQPIDRRNKADLG